MTNISEELSRVLQDISKVELSDAITSKLGNWAKRAKENATRVQVYDFFYKSNGALVGGFLIAPKSIGVSNLPVIFFNRGGNKDFGLIKRGMYFLFMAELAARGYMVVGSQYPGNSISQGVDEFGGRDVDSILDLCRLIKKLNFVDNKRIGMFGASRGGMMTYLCLKKVRWVKAAVVLAGVSDLVRNAKIRPEMQKVFNDTFGGELEAKKARSAINWPEKFPEKTPLLLLHGTADWRVSPLDSIDLTAALMKHNKPISLRIYEDGDHGLTQYLDKWHEEVFEWFDKYLLAAKATKTHNLSSEKHKHLTKRV